MASQTFQEAYERRGDSFTIFLSGGREAHGFFADLRVDRKTVPEGWHVYDMREGDDGEWFSQLKNGYIFANHMGTFVTQQDLGLPEGESLYYCCDNGEDDYQLEDDEFDYSFS